MTNQDLDRLAQELATAYNECDAGRLSGDDFGQMLDRALAGKSKREIAQIHLRIAKLQGRTVAMLDPAGEIEATNDEAEVMARRALNKLS